RDEAVVAQWPERYDEQAELDAALEAVMAAKAKGVQTIVDATAMFGGRDVRFMKRVADETAVRIVACTGIYSYDYLPHYTEDLDYIEGLLARGVYVGLDRYGLEMFLPIDKRNATAAELLRRGHAERLIVSQDYCATIDWYPAEAREVFEGQGAIRSWSMTL